MDLHTRPLVLFTVNSKFSKNFAQPIKLQQTLQLNR